MFTSLPLRTLWANRFLDFGLWPKNNSLQVCAFCKSVGNWLQQADVNLGGVASSWRCVECAIHHKRDVRKEWHPYMWREQATIEWFRRVISVVACCHSVKFCELAIGLSDRSRGNLRMIRREHLTKPVHCYHYTSFVYIDSLFFSFHVKKIKLDFTVKKLQ